MKLLSMLAEADACCFEDFSSNELQEVCTLTRIIRIPRDGYILEHGKIPSHLVFLIQGVVEIHTFGGAETDQGSEPGSRQASMHGVAQVTSLGSFIGGASRCCTHSPRFVVRSIRSPNALGRSVVAPCFHQLEVSWVWGFAFINANHPALRRYRPLREPRSCRRGSAQKVPMSGPDV
jgi:hypothetical protein